MTIHHIILFCLLVPVQIDAFNFLFIKKWLLLLLDRYLIFELEMDIFDIVKLWIYSFNYFS